MASAANSKKELRVAARYASRLFSRNSRCDRFRGSTWQDKLLRLTAYMGATASRVIRIQAPPRSLIGRPKLLSRLWAYRSRSESQTESIWLPAFQYRYGPWASGSRYWSILQKRAPAVSR